LKVKLDELQAKFDALDSVDISAEVKKLVQLQSNATKVLGGDFKFDGLDEKAINTALLAKKRELIVQKRPTLSLEGKSDVYVEAMYDAIFDGTDTPPASPSGFSPNYHQALYGSGSPSSPATPGRMVNDAMDKAMEKQNNYYSNAWKPQKGDKN